MNLMFSSHILPDVETVCDHVIVLGRGKLLAEGSIEQLRQTHDQLFDVRLKSDGIEFVKQLQEAGCRAELQDDFIRVGLPPSASEQLLWKIAAKQNEQIRHLRPQRSTLEEVFLAAVERV
jgi:ABC-2 type transport system ATP-binding protein